MRRLILAAVFLTGSALAQPALEANSIVVTAAKSVVLLPTDISFMLTVSADPSLSLDQILAAIDMGLTAQDLVGINSYPIGPYPGTGASRINYQFRLNVPLSQMKETAQKLERLRKTLDTGIDLNYSTISIGPSPAAVLEAREKALPELIADAQKRAQGLAAAAQLKLGAVQALNEGVIYTGGPFAPLPPAVSFTVTVRFAAQ